jgi:hypothetical protein
MEKTSKQQGCIVSMENPMGRPRFVIGLKSNRPTGDVGPRIPPIQRCLCSEIFWQTEIVHLFELTLWNEFSQSAFLSNVGKMFS